jgi:hypothetical protein
VGKPGECAGSHTFVPRGISSPLSEQAGIVNRLPPATYITSPSPPAGIAVRTSAGARTRSPISGALVLSEV